ncbi:MAG: T9SS type A sorting domain-containing protein [Bacteroidetes bacterium]|nr:T9SS type A sorting domain-containing protein [Bacteroidota bacterium]MBS1757654.1 T9SS type A sorting domain-containing protein [Bacteroidota bacterium]
MRYFCLILCLVAVKAMGQQYPFCKNVLAIAAAERDAHIGMTNGVQGSLSSDNYDIKYFRCEWEVDPAVRYINGKVTMYFYVPASTSSITLDLSSHLITDSVTCHGQSVGFLHPAEALAINFANAIAANTLDSVSIYYHGVPGNTGFGSFIQDSHLGTPVIWTLSEPYGAKDWWPCKTNLGDKADSIDVYITHPSNYKAASNGLLQSETLINGGTKMITHWKHRYPIASYLVCFAVTNYSVFNNTVQLGNITLPMLTYCYPENLALFQANTPMVLSALQLYHNTFGDYPFIKEKYGHVQFGWGGGMEHQTSTFIITPEEGLMAHELGHQWFGDKITTGSWEDIWLNEGFATFCAAFYMETAHPQNKLGNRKAVLDNITSLPNGSVKVDDTTNVGRIFDGRLTYNKGSYLLNMLRFKLGDSVFFSGLRKYQKDPAVIYGYARTADLQRNLEQVSGIDLSNFFKEWYAGQGYPSYHVSWSQLGTQSVQIKMNQTTSDASVPFFELPVALTFKNATQQKTVIVDNKINNEIFVKNIGFAADTVLVDPEYWLITKNNTTEKLALPNSGKGAVEIYPNPATGPLTVYLHDFAASNASLQIYNALGQMVLSKNIQLINGAELIQLPMSNFSHGIYMVKVIADNKKFVQPIIK